LEIVGVVGWVLIGTIQSWQTFIDFNLPEDARASYAFLPKYDDFYLSLMSRAFKLLKSSDSNNPDIIAELLSLAKGLEIFSLNTKKDNFRGINQPDNLLFAAGLYYLTDYSASAWILSKCFPIETYQIDCDIFITSFLRRNIDIENIYVEKLKEYLWTGEHKHIIDLLSIVEKEIESNLFEDAGTYIAMVLIKTIINKFAYNNIWFDLLSQRNDLDFWRPYVHRNLQKKVPVWSFFPSQRDAIIKGVLKNNTCSLQMPTSSGKTSISELIIYNEFTLNPNCKILYLAPFRALASELKSSLATNLSFYGIKSKTIYGGNLPTAEERTSIKDVSLIIATPEKFMAIEDILPNFHKDFTMVICDEGHLLDDKSRGLSYELLLSRLKCKNNSNARFIFISAIIPNISVINSWLGGNDESLFSSNYRPTELEFAFLMPMNSKNTGYYLDVNPKENQPKNYKLYKYLFDSELKLKDPSNGKIKKINSKKGISAAVAIKALKAGSVALFAPHKRGNTGVEGLAAEVLLQIECKRNMQLASFAPEGFLESLSEYFTILFGSNYLLTTCAKIGILYHHGDLPQSVREIIEDALRKSFIKLVVCTNTLAEGVNLPIRTIVIHSTSRFNPAVIGKYEPLKKRDLKNLVGRAGRAGKETKGLVIIPHSEDFSLIEDLIHESNIEPVKGYLYDIVKTITGVLTKNRLKLNSDILEKLDEYFQTLLDSIDMSMINLLSEEVDNDTLTDIVKEQISQTLSFYQSTPDEKETLENIFSIRAEKIKPFIANGEFKFIRNSGASLRVYESITNAINYDDEIWQKDISPLDEDWLQYILDDGIFKIKSYRNSLDSFCKENRIVISDEMVKNSIIFWIQGLWYVDLSIVLGLEIHQILRLINSFISFTVQSIISTIIRIREIKIAPNDLPKTITNWPQYLQHGVNTHVQIDLIEMGLIDRISVYGISNLLHEMNYSYSDYSSLKFYLRDNKETILSKISNTVPKISLYRIEHFFKQININNLF